MMDLILKIAEKTKKTPSVQGFTDWKDVCREIMKTDIPLAVEYLVELSEILEKEILGNGWSDNEVRDLFGLHKKVLLLAAPHHFESFLLYIEQNREPEKKFYLILTHRSDEVMTWVKIAVKAAEQIFEHGDNKAKLDYVTSYISRKFKISPEDLEKLIESAVYELKE